MMSKVIANPNLKHCFILLNNIALENTVVKATSQRITFYARASHSRDITQSTFQLSSLFMENNGINNQQYFKLQAVAAASTRQIVMRVNIRDWSIIANKRNILQQAIMGQINVVYEGLIVPIFYNHNAFVLMKCEQCGAGATVLKEDTLLNIEPEVDINQNNQQSEQTDEIVLQLKQKNSENQFGYHDQILIDKNISKLKQEVYYRVEDHQLHWKERVRSIKTYIQEKKKEKTDKKQNTQTWVVKFKHYQNEHNYQCSFVNSFFVYNFYIPSSIQIVQEYSPRPEDGEINITSQLFMSASNKLRIYFLELQQTEQQQHSLQYIFKAVINKINNDKQVLFVNGKIIQIEGRWFLTRLQEQVKEQKNIEKILILNSKKRDLVHIEKEMSKKVFILSNRSYLKNYAEKYRTKHYQIVNKAIKGVYQYRAINHVSKIYQQIYQKEIGHIENCLQKHQLCLLWSKNKNGKTFFSQYLMVFRPNYIVAYLDFDELCEPIYNIADVLQYLECYFQNNENPNTLFFLDNVSSLCKNVAKDLHRQTQFIASAVITRHLSQLFQKYCQYVIITASHPDDLCEEARKIWKFQEVQLKNPHPDKKRLVLQNMLGHQQRDKLDKIYLNVENMNFKQFLEVINDQQSLENYYQSIDQSEKKIKKQQLQDFSKIAGLKEAKRIIIQTIQTPSKYSFLYRDLPIKLPRGVLLYGPSGVGKTLLCSSIKHQMPRLAYFEIKGSDILNKYIGASEQAVRDIFEKAMSVAPSVVFFDEFESIVTRRAADNTGVTDRVVNQFLCYLDGVANMDGVFIVAASSRPDMIDPAILRPGRIDKHIYLEYPDSQSRSELLEIVYKYSIQFEDQIASIVQRTEGYSYSDLVGLIKQLRIKRATQLLKSKQPNPNYNYISIQFFEQIYSTYKVSTNQSDRIRQHQKYLEFRDGVKVDISHQKTLLK